MKETTKKLIRDFSNVKKPENVSAIILALQEEDNVSEVLRYKNCFRALRNIAAHEPNTLARSLMAEFNHGCQKLVIETVSSDIIVLDMIQFAVWMMDMYLMLHEVEYLLFMRSMYIMLYEPVLVRFKSPIKFNFKIINGNGLITSYAEWTQRMYDEFGIIKPISLSDPYINKLYEDNKKIFWKVAVPDMMNLACYFMAGAVNLRDEQNLKYFVSLYSIREGGCI